ncbi:hydantoinase B/oxoprolinase family protein [Roseiarcaceae bacterium H3SJ34-1]|uniref:hydantoinase B/oxoprolinase family protein n=1 Tax=Terripilifer ovatus TaxID=3032367 RepID=UPI003AB9B4A6|nr:hydantoinase B/oxoprolinase family protein [Roseiarcaceae bacterium H3SJ34-1]
MTRQNDELDPITADVIMHGLSAVPNLVDKNIARTAYSFLISEYKDYAVGIVDGDGRLITQSRGGLPIFVANALSAAVGDGLAVYGKRRLQHGDVVISNHGGTMGQHLNNVVMYTPIRTGEADDELLGFFAVVMHWMDVGGITIGSCQSPFTTDVFQEGIQFRTVKLLAGGERIEEMFRMIAENTRFPKLVLGDVDSQIAGCLTGRDMVLDVAARYGSNAVRTSVERFWARAEAATRAVIASIPDGVYRASSFLDDDGIERGKPVEINVRVVIDGDEATVDLSEVAAELKGPLNAGFQGGAVAAARMAAKYVFSPDGPANDGAFRPIKVVCPPGRFLSAGPTAPIGGSGFTIPSVVDTILRALAACLREHIPAAHHGTYSVHVIDGRDAHGQLFQHIESAAGGWGAAYDRDGGGPFRSMAHGDTMEVPVELQEASHPYLVEYARLRPDSGGIGMFRGGLGLEKAYRMMQPGRVTTSIERTACPPWGLEGGGEGVPGRVEIERADGSREVLLKGEASVRAGDRVLLFTAGGGGFGDPARRSRKAIAADLKQGYVTHNPSSGSG